MLFPNLQVFTTENGWIIQVTGEFEIEGPTEKLMSGFMDRMLGAMGAGENDPRLASLNEEGVGPAHPPLEIPKRRAHQTKTYIFTWDQVKQALDLVGSVFDQNHPGPTPESTTLEEFLDGPPPDF